jgi:hypothetical protein
MDIGQHFLEGTIVTLATPFIIIEKIKKTENDNNESQHFENNHQFEIQGHVKKKILFKTRPKPIGLKHIT